MTVLALLAPRALAARNTFRRGRAKPVILTFLTLVFWAGSFAFFTHVLRYFQTENFLLTTIGIVLGMLGAFGLNQLLMTHYELPRLPVAYLPVGALVLWLLGQLAVFGPARRAAAVPPAIATRSV